MTTQILNELWEELAAPSARAFKAVLSRRGIQVRAKDVEELVRTKSERQVIARGARHLGRIVALDTDSKWAADIVNFTSGPETATDGAVMTSTIRTRSIHTVRVDQNHGKRQANNRRIRVDPTKITTDAIQTGYG